MTIDEFCAEVPNLPTAQARCVYIYRDSGWSWEGDDGEGNIEMQRPDTMETTELIYITPKGVAMRIPPEWKKSK